MSRLLIATHNRGKIAELEALLSGLSLEIHTPDDYPDGPEVEETEPTLEGNALLKARAWNKYTGLPALADDTGLEVDALGGKPGVRSARYAGDEANAARNREKLLADLGTNAALPRSARFRVVVAFVDGEERTFEGVCEGEIAMTESGTGGFGYDSIFRPTGYELTLGDLDADTKNRISHRAAAMRAATRFLKKRFAG